MNLQDARAQLLAAERNITDMILSEGEEMMQAIGGVGSGTVTSPSASNANIQVPFRAVGLVRGFLVKVSASFTNNSGGSNATLTNFGAANVISNFTLTDLDNYQRVNTTGWHIWMLNTAKEGFPFASALTAAGTDNPVKTGSNFTVVSATATVNSGGGTGTINMYYWIPCCYGKRDLRGMLYAGTTNAVGYLNFTINTAPFIPTGSDATLACYTGGGAAGSTVMSSLTYTVYQSYIDQIPRYQDGPQRGSPILPPIGFRTQYRLVNTTMTGLVANQQFAIPFTNFQQFLSLMAIYDQNGTLNAGTDITSWQLQAANTLQFFNVDAITQALRSRVRIKTDWPVGAYMLDFRDKPISTNQAGNMQAVLQPSSVAAGSAVLVGWESFADVNAILGAQSLSAS